MSQPSLEGRVVVVTGASRGIGKAVAVGFAAAGARLVVAARSATPGRLPGTVPETVEAIRSAGGQAVGVTADVSTEEGVDAVMTRALAAYGRIDVLVHCAGITLVGPFAETSVKHLDLAARVNLRAAYLVTRAVLPAMMAQRSGSIVHFTARMAAVDVPAENGVAYAMTKAAVNRMVTALAQEVRTYDIAVNGLIPGKVRSEGAELWEGDRDWTGWVLPADVVPAVAALAVQTARTMTGRIVLAGELGLTWPESGGR